ncbi:MAG: MarR family transcriptional regulator [Rhodobacteraceae bacterium]|nr:MarR family transcriptional regulator [Paracoccaceae bacterium]
MESVVSIQQGIGAAVRSEYLVRYLDNLALLERLHRLLLDLIKDEFERLGINDVNPVQALLLFNIGENEVTAGELKSRGYYQGSNVSYNLKKLVDQGYMHHQRCPVDRRAVRVRLTKKGGIIREQVAALFARHAEELQAEGIVDYARLDTVARSLRQIERFWGDRIRYIY